MSARTNLLRNGGSAALLSVWICSATWGAVTTISYSDKCDDTVVRRMDPNADDPVDPAAHALPDLLQMNVSLWDPTDPAVDLFAGSISTNGQFMKLELVINGLVNPPGDTFPAAQFFAPFDYGPNPIYGYVEIDMDLDTCTGGELEFPEYHYLGNLARFGAAPSAPRFVDRYARSSTDFDGIIETAQFVDRSGEEFHLALVGNQFLNADINRIVGDSDNIFEAGETWQIQGDWFHRAHGFEAFTVTTGGFIEGGYIPFCTLEFWHDQTLDVTHVTLVYPLSNEADALSRGEAPEPLNRDATDQSSVLEALDDLQFSASVYGAPTPAPEEILLDWAAKDPTNYLDPTNWAVAAILGTSYTDFDPSSAYFVWTDVYPDLLRGDVDGDGLADQTDRTLIQQYITDNDSADGTTDQIVVLQNFAVEFHVFDINHNGQIDNLDVLLVSDYGDQNEDSDLDLQDFAEFSNCFSGTDAPYGASVCGLADLDGDADVDLVDIRRFQEAITGPN